MITTKRYWFGVLGLLALAFAGSDFPADAESVPDSELDKLAKGKELFTRIWVPGDKRSHAGDGLGPVFNGRSCAECHNQGGTGGAGPQKLNPMLVTAFVQSFSLRGKTLSGLILNRAADDDNPLKQPDRAKLAEIHPILRSENSFPIHRFGAGNDFMKWQVRRLSEFAQFGGNEGWDDRKAAEAVSKLLAQGTRPLRTTDLVDGVNVALILSQRNTPALFGAGLIDRIPDRILEEVEAEQARKAIATARKTAEDRSSLPVSGRVARLKNGRIGRFGWKGNVASLREFTLQACSSELGLEVPGFPKSLPAWIKDYKAPGLDMTAEQCDLLVQFVGSLPRPGTRSRQSAEEADEFVAGRIIFASIGCATCHRPDLGDVQGIYSDLLLHDMGQFLSDAGDYGTNPIFVQSKDQRNPLPVSDGPDDGKNKEKHPKFGGGALEWRTPPLWGLRDSAPYLHDGRAPNIGQAINLHGGEGSTAEQAYRTLSSRERQQLESFLLSLAAPAPAPERRQ